MPNRAAITAMHNRARAEADSLITRARQDGGRELTPEEDVQVRDLLGLLEDCRAELRALDSGQITREQETDAAVRQLAALTTGAGSDPASGIPPLMPAPEVLEQMRSFGADSGVPQRRWAVSPEWVEDVHTRAVVTTSATGLATISQAVRPLNDPRRLAVAAGLRAVAAGAGGTKFPIFGDADSADVVSEGGTKPEYDAVTAGSAVPAVIGLWSSWTTQVGETFGDFETRLRAKLAARVARREDKLMVDRVLAASGIQTHAGATTNAADALLVAAAKVADSDVGAAPNPAVVNPADIVALVGGTSVGVMGERPSSEMRLQVHGLDLYVTSAITAGTALVGAWPEASELVVGFGARWLLDPYTLLTTNGIRGRLEEAVTLAVTEPSGFCSITELVDTP
jgi:hypothetical protein